VKKRGVSFMALLRSISQHVEIVNELVMTLNVNPRKQGRRRKSLWFGSFKKSRAPVPSHPSLDNHYPRRNV
jgi:hypothetical protein